MDEITRRDFLATVDIPRLHHLQRRLSAGDAVIILFGSYKPNPDRAHRFERVGGHYVTAVGYGRNAAGEPDPAMVILHDSNDGVDGCKYVRAASRDEPLELWSDGELLGSSEHWVQLEDAPIRQDGRIAFLETVLAFRVAASE